MEGPEYILSKVNNRPAWHNTVVDLTVSDDDDAAPAAKKPSDVPPNRFVFTFSDGRSETVKYTYMQQKGQDTFVAAATVRSRPVVVKFTNEQDVKVHRELYENPETRQYIVPLVADVASVRGNADITRKPHKVTEFIELKRKRKVNQEEMIADMVAALEPHVQKYNLDKKEWKKPDNLLWKDGRPLAHDFDV